MFGERLVTCRFDDREEETETNFHTMLNSLQLKWMKRDVFFLPDQTYSQKGPIKKPRESLKKSKTSSFFDPHSEEWPERRIFAKNQTLWLIGGWRGSTIPVLLGICLSQAISVLRYQPWKSAETSKRPFMRTGKKTPTNKSERSTEATKPKSCSFFLLLAYTTSWDKWFVFWISSRSSSFTFELRLSPL